jgi:hypothetical protein
VQNFWNSGILWYAKYICVEESLHEKDKLVDNLHYRLQTQMYDVQGGPLANIHKQVASPIHSVSTTGRRDEPNKMGTSLIPTCKMIDAA